MLPFIIAHVNLADPKNYLQSIKNGVLEYQHLT